jgi:SAM-dependent methyltransferase
VFDTYAEIFAERARGYHSAMEAHPRAREAEFRSVLAPLEGLPGGTLCDMPAGGGYLADRLPPRFTYIGVDPAGDFVAAGVEAGARIIRAELAGVPLEARSVDYVVSLAGLHHEPNLAAVFREMRRLTRPGGRVVLADVGHATPPARFLNGFVARNSPMGHDGRFLNDDTAELLRAAGLAVLDDSIVAVPWVFPGIDDAASFAAQLFGVVQVTQSEVAEALSSEIGFTDDGSDVRLDWSLRRLVCTPE